MFPRSLPGRILWRIPVRWRLASVSALMTFMILFGFALLVGQMTSSRLHGNFNSDLIVAAADLQDQIRVTQGGSGGLSFSGPDLDDYSGAQNAVIRVVTGDGTVLGETKNAPNLGKPISEPLKIGDLSVVSRPIVTTVGFTFAWVQYARRPSEVDRTIDQMWILLGIGVLGGTLLALMGGMGLARRAMRPISELTSAAREIGRTRDPARSLPQPTARDEIADLARTLDQMLRSLNEARSETEAVLKVQREFVADASHELRTPLTSVLANLELLQQESSGDRAAEETVEAALSSSRRMRKLIGDLLLLARTDVDRKSERITVDLGEIVRDVIEEIAPLASDHSLEYEAASVEMPVRGNTEELHRLILNLVDNALRHTPPDTEVKVSLSVEDKNAKVEVSDRGPGIPDELRSRVFGRFITGVGGKGGTGLGLAIVHAVAESHGGSITMLDSSGGGTCFIFKLPLASPDL